MRPFRYPRDYAPQLAALEWVEPIAARRRAEVRRGSGPALRDQEAAAGLGPCRVERERRAFLLRYVDLAPTPLEAVERLEQLRVLEHGERIAVAIETARHHGVDTPEQYEAFVARERARHG